MPLAQFGKRHIEIVVPNTRLGQVKAQVARAADRVGPMAGHARDTASGMATHARDTANAKVFVARGWAAPRLDAAAHSLEEQIAPKVSAILSQAASRIDPTPVAKSRRWPVVLLFTGLAVGAIGFAMYRKSTSQWTEAMKDNMSDASSWVGQKTHAATDKAAEMAHSVRSKAGATAEEAGTMAEQAGDKADATANQVSKKLS
ncbi:hypothetical protein ACQPYK_00500 [Streptosporangium sp. CA-135522]|uniref:hypothetical protein n=1 Tax=Streptosporangium sp. CA-135522 TaxID=3240072 RepID=UPI003D8AC1C1